MEKAHDVQRVTISGTTMKLCVDGNDYEIDLAAQSSVLATATADQRANFQITPSGYGIHWPELDEDLSIDCLVGLAHARPAAASHA